MRICMNGNAVLHTFNYDWFSAFYLNSIRTWQMFVILNLNANGDIRCNFFKLIAYAVTLLSYVAST
jgi:hypothetical protein